MEQVRKMQEKYNIGSKELSSERGSKEPVQRGSKDLPEHRLPSNEPVSSMELQYLAAGDDDLDLEDLSAQQKQRE